jgi:two-component system response regulator DesR
VFLADDSWRIRERVAAMLGESACTVVGEGETPQACIGGILAVAPDVVVLDVQLEGGTGLEVLRAVRPLLPSVAFVVFSNSSGPAYRQRYLAHGASHFLDKTEEFEQLPRAIASAARVAAH